MSGRIRFLTNVLRDYSEDCSDPVGNGLITRGRWEGMVGIGSAWFRMDKTRGWSNRSLTEYLKRCDVLLIPCSYTGGV